MSATAPPASPPRGEPLPRLGLFLLVALTLVWGNNWPVMKVALSEIPPWTFRAICTFGGAAGLFVLCRLGRIPVAVPRGNRLALALLAFFNITCWNLLSAYGVSLMAAGRASIIAFTMPVWVVLLGALFLGERITARRVLALALGLASLAVLIGPDIAALGAAPLGALFMCGAAFAWASGTIVLKRAAWKVPVVAITAWQLALGGVPIVIGALVWEAGDLGAVGVGPVLAVLYNVFVCFIFGNYAWLKIVSLFPAGVAGISSLMIPVIGVFSSALFLGEPLGAQEVAALVLVLGALTAVLRGQLGARKAAA